MSNRARRLVAGGLRRSRALFRAAPQPGGNPSERAPRPAERLLAESPLFDVDWYCLQLGRRLDRAAAVGDYLDRGAAQGRTPNPLFDPEYFTEQFAGEIGERDPFVVYLRRGAFGTPTHPLFDTRGYRRANPEAREHPHGPLGHYQETGAPEGVAPNDWLGEEGEPSPDLIAWIRDRRKEWSERQGRIASSWVRSFPADRAAELAKRYADTTVERIGQGPVVSVVVMAGRKDTAVLRTLTSLADQTMPDWQALVVTDDSIPNLPELLADALPGADATVVSVGEGTEPAALNRALASAAGEFVAFLAAGDSWSPDRLRLLVAVSRDRSAGATADTLEGVNPDGTRRYARHGQPAGHVVDRTAVDLARLLVGREVLSGLGGFDESLPGGWEFDFVTRLSRHERITVVPAIGVHRDFKARSGAHRLPASRRPVVDHPRVDQWADVVLNRSLVDWESLAGREQRAGVVSVIITTSRDWRMTTAAVASVIGAAQAGDIEVDCLVWNNGSGPCASVMLDALPLRFPGVRVLHSATNLGFALGNNLAVPHAVGETIVFLNNDTTVAPGWLEPLVAALEQPDVLGAQPLLIYPAGSIQSAGIVFPSTGGIPYSFLRDFPVEDAAGVEDLPLSALTGAALALRYDDVVALRGFDPLFLNGMEDIDLCLRLKEWRSGRFTVLPASRVVRHESRTEARYQTYLINRQLYLDRWSSRAPRDDVALWASQGFRVLDHQVTSTAAREPRLSIPMPVLMRESRLSVGEGPPRLRWAIKNPAPAGPAAEKWGDTHFARAVASALRQCGQEVVIDNRPEFERVTARHDDVSLVLRGLAPCRVTPENVSIAWVISHPEMLGRPEASTYDRIVAASVSWSEEASRTWGLSIEPMLQATDPGLFHPDRAVPDTGHPVLFVGSSRNQYRPVVRNAVEAGLPLSIYGPKWKQFVPEKYIKALYLDNADLGAAYRSAGVVLNDHWEDMRAQGFLSNRLFDAAGSGARIVTDDVAGLGDIFGRSVQVMRSVDDLTRLTGQPASVLDEIFGCDDERRDVAARIHRDHSFLARAERLIEIAVEARRERGFS